MYGAAALLNHACAPSVALAFDGGALTVRALRRHAPGERLLHCYGPQARALPAVDRRGAALAGLLAGTQAVTPCHVRPCAALLTGRRAGCCLCQCVVGT